MASLRFGVAGVCSLVLGAGCGGSKPAVTSVPPATSGTSADAEVLAPLTPVQPPPELFAVARIANPEKTSDTAIAWSGLPVNWRSLLDKEIPGVERTVAMSAPVDFAAAIDPTSGEAPRLQWAFAVGAASTDAAATFLRSQGLTVTPAGGGVYRVQAGSDLSCVVSRSLGATPARVVCSDSIQGAEAMVPYMTRGMPTESFGTSDIHIHVTAEPWRRRYGAQIGLVRTVGVPFLLREIEVDHPKLDRALHDVLYGGADELVALAADVDRLDIDTAAVAGSDNIDLSLSLSLIGQKSWWAQTMAKAAGQMSPAPDTFWKLPASATSATFSAYSDPERFRGIALSLKELADGFLDYQKLPEARRKALVDVFERVMTSGARSVQATLPFTAPASTNASNSDVDAVKTAIGQHLVITDKAGPDLTLLFSEFVKTVNDKTLRAHLVKEFQITAAQLLTARERPLAGKGLPPGGKRFDVTIPGALFTPDGHFSLDKVATKVPPKGKPQPPLNVVLLVVPDGPLTWMGFGIDEAGLLAAINEARAGTGKTLSTREGLSALHTDASLSGGFTSLASLLSSIDRSLSRHGGAALTLEKLPHLGATPMVWSLVSDAKGAGPKVAIRMRVPKAVIEDSVGLAATEVARASR